MGKLTTKQFDGIVKAVLDPLLTASEGFGFRKGIYWRELPSGLRHLIGLDFDVHRGRFSVMVGFNAAVVTGGVPPEDAGFAYVEYLSPGGLANRVQFLRASDSRSADDSLKRVRVAIESFALPWLRGHDHLRSLSDLLGPELDALKGELLLAHGDGAAARPWLERYLVRLSGFQRDSDVEAAIARTQKLLAEC